MFFAIGRAAIRRIGGAPSAGRAQQIQRVLLSQSRSNGLQSQTEGRTLPILLSGKRFYGATASRLAKTATTTGGTQTDQKTTKRANPAKKSASAAKSAKAKTAVKPATPKRKVLTERQLAKKAADKEKQQAKKAADKEKQQAKKTAEKEKAKAKALKAKEKNAAEKVKSKLVDLKAKILTPPKSLPETSFMLLFKETVNQASEAGGPMSAVNLLKESAARYKTLDVSTREAYDHQASENKATNAANFEAWILSHTPQQIYESNRALNHLQRLGKVKGRKIADPRLPKGPLPPHILFLKTRYDSGDMKGISLVEAQKALSEEWKKLSAEERKPFEERSQARKEQWEKGMIALFGTITPAKKTA